MMKDITLQKRKNWMRTIIWSQTTGVHGLLAFRNSILLLYLLSMGLSQKRVIAYISLWGVCNLLRIPAAYFSDKYGKKFFGTIGNWMCFAGYILIAASGFAETLLIRESIVVLGIAVYSCGDALFGAAWFPLLRPIVPGEIRGRFFGKLRISWQLAGLFFSGAVAFFIGQKSKTGAYQIIMGIIAALLVARSYFYAKLPELEKSKDQKEPFISLLGKTFRIENYASFSAYIFLLMIFSYNTPNVFAMVEKEVMKLNPETVVWLANAGLIGALAGYYIGGLAVDRFSSKPIFLVCHFGYAALSFLFLFRELLPVITIPVLAFCHFGFGFVYASSSIAITSEIFGLMPKENQALANSILTTMLFLGTAVSGLLCAWIMNFNFLKETWLLLGMQMSNYDAILLLNGGMIILLAAALGLVPSIIRKAMPLPS